MTADICEDLVDGLMREKADARIAKLERELEQVRLISVAVIDSKSRRLADLEATANDLREALDGACEQLNDPPARIAELEHERDHAVREAIRLGIEVSEARERNVELTVALRRCLQGMTAPTHAANDANCQDWPIGEQCHGCQGDALRAQIVDELRVWIRY